MSLGCNIYIFIVLAAVLTVLVSFSSSYPLHASCKIKWSFGEPCDKVSSAIKTQISKWTSSDGCKNGGEKCLYKLVSQSSTALKATHETPQKHYVDTLTFTFTDGDNMCTVDGTSSSNTWYAVLDYGTNYCNLHNLITGAGLDKIQGYKEVTSDSICTQFSSANCTVY